MNSGTAGSSSGEPERHAARLVEFDSVEVDGSGTLRVSGRLPDGLAVRLVPRRYKSTPEWWCIDVEGTPTESSTGTEQGFSLSCDLAGLWGTAGVEVVGDGGSERLGRGAATTESPKSGSGAAVRPSQDRSLGDRLKNALRNRRS